MDKQNSPSRSVNLAKISEIDEQVSSLLLEKANLKTAIVAEIEEEIASIKATIKSLRDNIIELVRTKASMATFKLSAIAEKMLRKKD